MEKGPLPPSSAQNLGLFFTFPLCRLIPAHKPPSPCVAPSLSVLLFSLSLYILHVACCLLILGFGLAVTAPQRPLQAQVPLRPVLRSFRGCSRRTVVSQDQHAPQRNRLPQTQCNFCDRKCVRCRSLSTWTELICNAVGSAIIDRAWLYPSVTSSRKVARYSCYTQSSRYSWHRLPDGAHPPPHCASRARRLRCGPFRKRTRMGRARCPYVAKTRWRGGRRTLRRVGH